MYLASFNESVPAPHMSALQRERQRNRIGLALAADNGPSLCVQERSEAASTGRDPIAMEAARLVEKVRTEHRRAQDSDTPDYFYVYANWSSDDVLYVALARLNAENGIKLGSMTAAGDQMSLYMVCERREQEDDRSWYDMMPCDV